MSDTRNDTVSVVERTHAVAASGAVIAAHFLGKTAAFVLAEEAVVLAEPTGEPRTVAVHGGAILAVTANDNAILTGGDYGKVITTNAKGQSRDVATDPKHRWMARAA